VQAHYLQGNRSCQAGAAHGDSCRRRCHLLWRSAESPTLAGRNMAPDVSFAQHTFAPRSSVSDKDERQFARLSRDVSVDIRRTCRLTSCPRKTQIGQVDDLPLPGRGGLWCARYRLRTSVVRRCLRQVNHPPSLLRCGGSGQLSIGLAPISPLFGCPTGVNWRG